jgi:hypothetical protein
MGSKKKQISGSDKQGIPDVSSSTKPLIKINQIEL